MTSCDDKRVIGPRREVCRRSSATGGFTLLEMLMTSVLLTSVLLTLTFAFVQGANVFERIGRMGQSESAAIFFEKMTRDLRNAVNASRQPFVSTERSLSFVTLVMVPKDTEMGASPEDKDPELTCYWVRYDYDAPKKIVKRTVGPLISGAPEQRTECVAQGVEGIRFEASNPAGSVPARVLVEAEFDQGGQRRVFKKLIALPVGLGFRR